MIRASEKIIESIENSYTYDLEDYGGGNVMEGVFIPRPGTLRSSSRAPIGMHKILSLLPKKAKRTH